jgi:hypothetical protein
MASIIHAENNVASLEIEEDELPRLRGLIESNWGAPQVVRHLACDTIRIADEEFTFQNEWGDPCLIAGTSEGLEILKKLRDQLNTHQ